MNVDLTPSWEAFVKEKVRSGRYATADDVVREGLRLLQRREPPTQPPSFANEEELQALLEAGMASVDKGDVVDGPEAFDRLKEKMEE